MRLGLPCTGRIAKVLSSSLSSLEFRADECSNRASSRPTGRRTDLQALDLSSADVERGLASQRRTKNEPRLVVLYCHGRR